MKDIFLFKPQFNHQEQKEIIDLKEKIWEQLMNVCVPCYHDKQGKETKFIQHSISVTNMDGVIEVLDTSTQPYIAINNRYILGLFVDSLIRE